MPGDDRVYLSDGAAKEPAKRAAKTSVEKVEIQKFVMYNQRLENTLNRQKKRQNVRLPTSI